MLPPPSYARRGGEIVASQLRAVGIEPQIVNVEWAQWLEQVFKNKDFDLTIISHTEPMDIGIYARPDYYFGYDDPAMRALMNGRRRHRRPGRARRDPAGGAGADRRATSSTSSCSSSPRPASPTPGSRACGQNSPTQADRPDRGVLDEWAPGRDGSPVACLAKAARDLGSRPTGDRPADARYVADASRLARR